MSLAMLLGQWRTGSLVCADDPALPTRAAQVFGALKQAFGAGYEG